MKNAKLEKQLMADIWSANLKDSPLKFVKYIFDWGKAGTPPLKTFDSPRKWQEKFCEIWKFT